MWLMISAACLAVLLILFLYWQDNGLTVSALEYKNKMLPPAFDGFRIVHISDFHNKRFGKGQKKIVSLIASLRPDIIVITGDLIDRRHTDLEAAEQLIRRLVPVARVFYVTGNHEQWSRYGGETVKRAAAAGAVMLDDRIERLERDGAFLDLIGAADPAMYSPPEIPVSAAGWERFADKLHRLCARSGAPVRLLLCHRAEKLELYAETAVDLVFTGHAHGGQIRLPGIGGLYSPGQGLFPKYTSGLYRKGKTAMLVSRGIGNSRMPIRLFNRPEIILLTMKREQEQ